MAIPWEDEVTVSIDGRFGREIIAVGPLRTIVPMLSDRGPSDLARIVLAFADRKRSPFRYDGTALPELIAALRLQEMLELREHVQGRE